jgi:uncharacterized protein (DUF1501 family)
MKRRTFIQSASSAAGIAIGVQAPKGWVHAMAKELAISDSTAERILVVVQLTGGNDGLNTIVPHKNDAYKKARPKLKIDSNEVIALDEELGFHPSLGSLVSMLEKQRLAVIQGVGYANPNRSHFESMDIWHSCKPKTSRNRSGWIGRLLAEAKGVETDDSLALHLGNEPIPLALVNRGVQVPSLSSVEQFRLKADRKLSKDQTARSMSPSPASHAISKESSDEDLMSFLSVSTDTALQASSRIEGMLSTPDENKDFPDSELGNKLRTISRLILAGLKTRIYYVTLDGFDTHANQLAVHAALLRQWSESLAAFHARLDRDGQSDRVLVMTFSEFGRRVAENASLGTDHGAAAPMWLSGPKMKNTLVGELPSLTQLVDGDLQYHTDFRAVYRSVVETWFGWKGDGMGLGDFSLLPLFA